MIGRLRGEVIERSANQVVIDVGGVGYLVTVSIQADVRVGEQANLHIHTAVRDDAITLFGFANSEQKALFDLLIGVPGVGPVKAMNMLQTPVPTIVEMVASRNAAQLAKLPGVGKKTAERLLVDLGDKVSALGRGASVSSPAADSRPTLQPDSPVTADLISALINLGYKEAVAQESAQAAIDERGESAPLDELLREALARNRPKVGEK